MAKIKTGEKTNDVGVIIERLDNVSARLDVLQVYFDSFKGDIEDKIEERFDKFDLKIDKLILAINEQEKINLRHDMLISKCKEDIDCLGKRVNDHIDSHAVKAVKEKDKEIKETEEKTKINVKVGILWAIAVFVAVQLGLLIFVIIQGFIK
ncbi:MAG: hypothetical protein JXB50_12210 [Spirochaetes bacterium]|nr:hypothetical protein [Spirochaetota bacterium]